MVKWSLAAELLATMMIVVLMVYYQSWRKAPAFRHGDISHTLLPRKEILRGLH